MLEFLYVMLPRRRRDKVLFKKKKKLSNKIGGTHYASASFLV